MKAFFALMAAAALLTSCVYVVDWANPRAEATPSPVETVVPTPTNTPRPTPTPRPAWPAGVATVIRVIDGDTVEIRLPNGSTDFVRYIGIDTPETRHPRVGIEPWGPEASARNKELVLGKEVYLEKDVSDRDRYGRMLRYVWVDGEMVNATLVYEGLAEDARFRPDLRHAELFTWIELEAQEAKRGMWSE